jgi:scyllo-inositol 2-dehydrogenase (NADP+)
MSLRVASVGAGWVTSSRHIPALRQSKRCQLVGIIDKHIEKAQSVAMRCSLPNWSDSLDAPWLNEVQAFTVGTPPKDHFEVADFLLDKGKHVLLEKPMCLTVAEGELLTAKARSLGLTLAIVHNFQFARSAARARSILTSGRLGRVVSLHGLQLSSPRRRLPCWHDELPLGLFYDEAPHLLYLLRSFSQSSLRLRHASIVSSSRASSTPAIVQAEFSAGDIPATLFMNFESPVSEWHLMIFAEEGVLILDIFRDILVLLPSDHSHAAPDVVRSSLAMLIGHSAGFIRSGLGFLTGKLLYGNDEVVNRFLTAVETKQGPHGIDADTALEILVVQHDLLRHVESKATDRSCAFS